MTKNNNTTNQQPKIKLQKLTKSDKFRQSFTTNKIKLTKNSNNKKGSEILQTNNKKSTKIHKKLLKGR